MRLQSSMVKTSTWQNSIQLGDGWALGERLDEKRQCAQQIEHLRRLVAQRRTPWQRAAGESGARRSGHSTRLNSIIQFVSQVLPRSLDVACSQCADFAVMCDQRKRVRTVLPSTTKSA